jgi:hypothetical protein
MAIIVLLQAPAAAAGQREGHTQRMLCCQVAPVRGDASATRHTLKTVPIAFGNNQQMLLVLLLLP